MEVLGERLAREMPLSAALFAPELGAFLASAELAERPLAEAFRTFLRRRLIARHDEAAAAVVAAETVGRERFRRDLSELDAALAALRRRHLSAEELAEAMEQIARRVFSAAD